MKLPLVFYSTNTWLAFNISEIYYNSSHYVWCAPCIDGRHLNTGLGKLPPTSSPIEIYYSLLEEIRRGDMHSPKIEQNRVGLLDGAAEKFKTGIIKKDDFEEILSIVDKAGLQDFRPCLYVIPCTEEIENKVERVPVEKRAHPCSPEILITDLPRRCFDQIYLDKEGLL